MLKEHAATAREFLNRFDEPVSLFCDGFWPNRSARSLAR